MNDAKLACIQEKWKLLRKKMMKQKYKKPTKHQILAV